MFEGNFFSKEHGEISGSLSYAFCGPLFCEDFSEELSTPIPLSVTISTTEGLRIELDNVTRFCNETEVLALWYSVTDPVADDVHGRLYMKHEGVFREALHGRYESSLNEEVLQILSTIVEK